MESLEIGKDYLKPAEKEEIYVLSYDNLIVLKIMIKQTNTVGKLHQLKGCLVTLV